MTLRTAAHTAGAVEGAVDARLDAAGLWALTGPGPLDVRTGVVYAPGNPLQVLGTAATSPWAVTVGPGHVVGSKGASNGPYYAANDALTTVNLTVPPVSNSRIDVIYAMQQDTAAIVSPDGSTVAVLAAAVGTPGASPAVPAVPVGAVALAQVLIASTAVAGTSGAGVTITPVAAWTTTRGNPIPCRSQAERDAITLFDGLQAYRLDTHMVETCNGTVWAPSRETYRFGDSVAIVGTNASSGTAKIRQEFTAVATTNSGGGINIAYPTAFTGGVTYVSATPGDVASNLGFLVPILANLTLSAWNGIAYTKTGGLVGTLPIRMNICAVGW